MILACSRRLCMYASHPILPYVYLPYVYLPYGFRRMHLKSARLKNVHNISYIYLRLKSRYVVPYFSSYSQILNLLFFFQFILFIY